MSNFTNQSEPSKDCPLCPRLADFREEWRIKEPEWFNAPVPCFGSKEAAILIVGLAPGLRGANRTGRPFTGDYAGDLLYGTLLKFGLAKGQYKQRIDDGLTLVNARIANAVRCVPPENKPTPQEIKTCLPFLKSAIDEMKNLNALICLGKIAHDATLTALGVRKSTHPFGHGNQHMAGNLAIFDSYHCSRYNTNTGRLTTEMFEEVISAAAKRVKIT